MKNNQTLPIDPFNLIITGVGGQGNVMASRIVGDMLTRLGYVVTIGETFGASQRGGSVMSHLRVSSDETLSPQIPKGRADMIIALEPVEALRIMKDYGNPNVRALVNTRPIHPVGVICGEQVYPSIDELMTWISDLSAEAWFIDTTASSRELGHPVYGNVIAVGALAATGMLPLEMDNFKRVIARKVPEDKVAVNLIAFNRGKEMITGERR